MPVQIQNSQSMLSLSRSHLPVLADAAFSRLFKTLYPNGLDEYATPGQTPTPSRKGSFHSLQSSAHTSLARPSGFLARWGFTSSTPAPPVLGTKSNPSSGEIEELILSGAAFGELLVSDLVTSTLLNMSAGSRLWVVQPRALASPFQSQVRDTLWWDDP